MSRWLRLYADAMRNPKVMRLSDKDFRLWIRLLAVASENDGKLPRIDDLKLILSMRLDHLSSGLDRLISGVLIDVLADGYEPHGWSKFQYKSDTSTDRVAKHRAKGNVSETPPEAETEPEAERVSDARASSPQPRAGAVSTYPKAYEDFWNVYPRKEGKRAALKAYLAAGKRMGGGKAAVDRLLSSVTSYAAHPPDPQFIPHPATWLNEGRYDDPIEDHSHARRTRQPANDRAEPAGTSQFRAAKRFAERHAAPAR